MRKPKPWALLAAGVLLSALQLTGQDVDTHLVGGTANFAWPQTYTSAVQANGLPKEKVESFLNSLRGQVPMYSPIRVGSFRFALLEKSNYYLVAITGGERFYWNTDVISPQGQRFRYSEMVSHGFFPLAMQLSDLDGDGVDELVTTQWPAGYQGASPPPIYWYTVWRFRGGLPYDASAQFAEFYRGFVLGHLSYIEELLGKLRSADPESVQVPLAEIEYVRLKFHRVILREKNAGLQMALDWVASKDAALQSMGIWSLAEMPSSAAGEKLKELTSSANFADSAKAALARRARLFGKQEP